MARGLLTLKKQLTACRRMKSHMNAEFFFHDHHHWLGETATHPIEPRYVRLAALLRLVGTSPQRCRALPPRRITTCSGASNCFFKV